MITVVVRVWLPDRPGALGQVASRIGAVRGDVLGIEILEQGADRVIDELTVALPGDDVVSLLINEVDAVDGVSVEDVRSVELDRADPNLAALAAGAAMAESDPGERIEVLCSSVQRLLEADWSVVLRGVEVIAQVGDSPQVEWLTAFLAGSEHLNEVDESLPNDLAWGHLISSGLTVACGRSNRVIHERERVRLSLLARLADALL
ncbi:hypothetical protein [Ilumatobacter nonamiensis]|uniref:hypothetical protein n=1 Tax=Ilumatobacter nonamiensis TaxID=467093 RepID=UPI0003482B4F|nr:hypothetical protein [Ilumatobacter nonamiensis]